MSSKRRRWSIDPRQWNFLTWIVLFVWLVQPAFRNLPPSKTYRTDPDTGRLVEFENYQSLSELPFPLGWPLSYVEPYYPSTVPLPVGSPFPPPMPATIHPWMLIINGCCILLATLAVVYVLQKGKPRFSLLFLILSVTALAVYTSTLRWVALMYGNYYTVQIELVVYFLPIPLAIAMYMNWIPDVQSWLRRFPLLHEPVDTERWDDPEAAMVQASRWDMQGDWDLALQRYHEIAERWPEHRQYIQQRMDSIIRKQGVSGQGTGT